MRRSAFIRRRRLQLIAVAVVAAVLGLAAHAVGVFSSTEQQTIDTRFSIRGSQPQRLKNFLLVSIDNSTLSWFAHKYRDSDVYPSPAQWPFPRREDARVISALAAAGAKVIAVDIQYTQPTDNTDDQALADAIANASPSRVVLVTDAVGAHGSTEILGGNKVLKEIGATPSNSFVKADSDGVVRQMQYSYQGLTTFGTAIAAATLGHKIKPSLFGGTTTRVPIDYAGPAGTIPSISFWKIYDHDFNPKLVKGKTVIVGATAAELQDLHSTSTSGSGLMSGPELQASVAATVLDGIPLRFDAGWVNTLLIIALGMFVPLLGLRGWATKALMAGVLLAALYLVAAQLAFNGGRIIDVVDPLFALLVGTVATLAVVYLGEAFERQYARSTFARFVPPDVVDQVLASTDEDLRLAGVQRVCTVMFSDLRGFTQFSESQPVDKVIAVVNHYLNEMTEAIHAAGGTIIAYMGDGIMAVFGAPIEQDDHADRALRAAREMIGPRLARFNDWLGESGHRADLRMGVGLNTGPVMCGNVGSQARVEYTAIGDTTNTASRLEGMTKGTDHMLFMAESTKDALAVLADDVEFVEEFEVRGREQKMRVWSVPDPVS